MRVCMYVYVLRSPYVCMCVRMCVYCAAHKFPEHVSICMYARMYVYCAAHTSPKHVSICMCVYMYA
jgi:hypothetical protein